MYKKFGDMVGSIDLLRLDGSKIIKRKGQNGIFIPFQNNVVHKWYSPKTEKIKVFLNIYCKKFADKYGNSFIIRQMNSIEEKDSGEILGSLKTLKMSFPKSYKEVFGKMPSTKIPKQKRELDINDDDLF